MIVYCFGHGWWLYYALPIFVACMSMFVEHAESYMHVLMKAEYSEFKKHLAIGLQKRTPKSDGLKLGMTKSGELETYRRKFRS